MHPSVTLSQRPPPLLLQLGARRRGARGRVSPPSLPMSTQPPTTPIATTRPGTTTVARASISSRSDDALGPDEDLGLPRGEQRAAAAAPAGRLPPRAAKSTTTPRGRRGLPPKEPKQKKPGPMRRTAIDLLSQQQREREQRSAAERADALYALAVREGRWPPSSSSSSSSSLPQSAPHDDSDSDDEEDDNTTKRRPLLFEEAAALLAQARLADRLRRKVAPRIANASSWESLHARVLPRDLSLLDERCTALLMAKLPSLRPGGGEAVGKAAAAAAASSSVRRRFDTMVGAVAVATAPKLAGFADAALANVMAGMAAAATVADLRFLRAWAEAAAEGSSRWIAGEEEGAAADRLVTAGAAFGPALLSALLAAQDQDDDEEEEKQDRPSSSSSAAPATAQAAAAAFARLFFERTAAAFSSGDLGLRHVAPAARAAEAFLRCGLPSPGAEWWRAAFAAVVSGSVSGGGDEGDRRPSPRGSRATAQFAGAVASLGAALDAADPQDGAAAAAREAAPLLEVELRARAAAGSSSPSSPLSPAGAAAALRGLSSMWRAASGDGPSADTVAAVAALWRRRGFRARPQAAAALCDELAAAARRRGGGGGPSSAAFVPDAEWRAAFEAAVASRMCPPGGEPAGGGDEEGDETAMPAPLPRLRLRMRLRGAAAAEASSGPAAEEAASLALSSLALFSGWRHRPGAGWLAAFALSTRDSVASWPPRVLAAALASLGRALDGGGGGGASSSSSSVSPLWALAVLRSLASRASSSVDEADRRALADALAALPPLLGLGAAAGGGSGALATLQALAPSRLSPADMAALRSLGNEVADLSAVKVLLEMLG